MKKWIPIMLGMFFTLLALWMIITPTTFIRNLYIRIDQLGYDLALRTRVLTEKQPIDSNIVIIDIDNKSLKQEGRWPWSRLKVATLVDALSKQGVSIIAFDIFFAEGEQNIADEMSKALSKEKLLTPNINEALQKIAPNFAADTKLAKMLSQVTAVLAIGFLPTAETQNLLPPPLLTLSEQDAKTLDMNSAQGYIANIPILAQAAKNGGFVNIIPDEDGIIRKAPLIMNYKNGIYGALSVQTLISLLGEKISLITPLYDKSKVLEGVKIGERIIPTNAHGEALIPFVGRSYSFPYYSATDVMHNVLPQDALLGKIVFIGTSAAGMGDLKATAVQNPFPGVEIHASLLNGMLKHSFSSQPAWVYGAEIVLTLLLGVLASLAFPYLGPKSLLVIILLFPTAALFTNNWFWSHYGLVLSIIRPVMLVILIAILNLIYGYTFESRRRERLKEMFGQYVPPKFIDEMLKTTSDYGLRGENREMSVIFADIRNFTTISEDMSAHELVEMLNAFFTPMTEIIFQNRGTIDKYIGDLIMAFWGAPLKDKNHARHALESALQMQASLKDLRAKLKSDRNWPDIFIGIGINSGLMNVGNMGSRYRRNYTVLGDAVNLSSRVESLTKFYGVEIIATENTCKNQDRFILRKLDRVKVKGKKKGIDIFEVLGYTKDLSPEMKQSLADYQTALDTYYQQDWQQAEKLFTALKDREGEQTIFQIYLDRIDKFKVSPPPEDWDGTYTHISK